MPTIDPKDRLKYLRHWVGPKPALASSETDAVAICRELLDLIDKRDSALKKAVKVIDIANDWNVFDEWDDETEGRQALDGFHAAVESFGLVLDG